MSNFLDDLDKWVLDALEKPASDEPTAHPSQDVDDGNQPASTGARASENESDVKAEVPGESVDEAKADEVEGPGRGENTPSNSIGTEATATGESPAVETASVKAKPEDPGTSHPAKATMGEKYSAAQLRTMGDGILADIAVAAAASEKRAEKDDVDEAPEAPKATAKEVTTAAAAKKDDAESAEAPKVEVEIETEGEEKESSAKEIKEAEAAGKEAASMVAGALNLTDEATEQTDPTRVVSDIRKSASADADNVAQYLAGFLSKAAEGMPEMMDESVVEETSEAGTPEAEAAVDAEAVVPPAGGGAAGADLEALVQALVEAGVTPEELMALAEGSGGGAPMEEAAVEEAAAVPAAAPEAMPMAAEPKLASVGSKAWKDLSGKEKRAALAEALRSAASKEG